MATEDVTSTGSVVPKSELYQDGYTPSSASSLEDLDPSTEPNATDIQPVPKRKGGRKPIYATSEERKQRNRQAQAAFRERRTEYIKQLEKTIQHHEETLQSLQQSHRTAADECLMLRYKNSLLERILLEKGIDVQAELRLKGSPHLRPIRHAGPTAGQASPMQKAMLNRQQQVRQRPQIVPPIQTVNSPPLANAPKTFSGSPNIQPTPPSQQSSPSAMRSPAFSMRGSMASPTSEMPTSGPNPSIQRNLPQMQPNLYSSHPRSHIRSASASTTASQPFQPPQRQHNHAQIMQSNYYQPTFQKHYDQLDQEYDAQHNMLDDADGEDIDTDNYIPNFRLPPTTGTMHMGLQASPPTTTSAVSDGAGAVPQMPFDYDPMLDADPFGLTASMHFPNPFSLQNPARR